MGQVISSGTTECKQVATLPPYHLFERNGLYFIYFIERDCAFNIDTITYSLLTYALEMSLEEAAHLLVQEGRYPQTSILPRLAEAKQLRSKGLFRPPRNRVTKEARERMLEHRFSTPRTRLELALAESCNLACTYCYCSAVRDMPNQGLMTKEIAQKAVDWLFRVSENENELCIVLFGGEPLSNKPVFQFVMDYSDALAKEHGKNIRYSMTTNGTLLDDMAIHYIKKHNFGLMVSLDGPPEIHNAQCPTREGGPSFDLAAQGIKRLMRRRKRVTVRCTMTNARPNMLELVNYFEEFGFTRIVLGRAHNPICPSAMDCTPEDFDDFKRQEEEELLPWMYDRLRQGTIPPWFPYSSLISSPEPNPFESVPPQFFRCGACRGTMTVGADGRLYPCHRFVGMQQFVMGHINEGPNHDYAKDFWRQYDDAVDETCASCWARRRCNRPCPWAIAQSDGSFTMLAPHKCEETRTYAEDSIYRRYTLPKEFPFLADRLNEAGPEHREKEEPLSL